MKLTVGVIEEVQSMESETKAWVRRDKTRQEGRIARLKDI